MDRLDNFTLKLRTGPRGRDDLPHVRINDVNYELENVTGDASSGSVLSGSFAPLKTIQQFVLEGPNGGFWDVEETEISFQPHQHQPYTVRLGPVTLDSYSDMNLWYDSPENTFEV
jgi:hypothetical protein